MNTVCLRSLFLVAAMAFLASAGAPSAVAQTSYDTNYRPNKVMYAAKRANVWSGPGTAYQILEVLNLGEKVLVVAKTGSWFMLTPRAGHVSRFVYVPLLTEAAAAETTKTITYRTARYHGQTRNGRSHGRGVLTWAEGDRYEGDFVDGERTGRGVYTWADGDRNEGEWLNGKAHGDMWYIRADGSGYYSYWENGEERGYRVSRKAKWERYLAKWRREAGFDTTSEQARQKTKKAPARQAVRKGGSASGGERWGAYVEFGKYWEDTEGYAVAWNASRPEKALDKVVDLCLERGRSHKECTNSKRMYVFSLSAPAGREKEDHNREDVGPYNEVAVMRNRCILVMKFGTDIERRFFDSDQAAVARVDAKNSGRSSGTRWSILKIACNDR